MEATKMKDLKEVLGFIISLGEGMAAALQDGAVGVGDVMHLWEPISKLPDAFDGIQNVMTEIKDMTPEDLSELVAWAKVELDLPQDNVEALIEDGLDVAASLLGFVVKFKAEVAS